MKERKKEEEKDRLILSVYSPPVAAARCVTGRETRAQLFKTTKYTNSEVYIKRKAGFVEVESLLGVTGEKMTFFCIYLRVLYLVWGSPVEIYPHISPGPRVP